MQCKAGNGVIVAGTATKDAEYKVIGEKETPLASFSIAANARGESPQYVNCKAFGGILAGHARHIKKGDAVFAAGVIEPREYNGKTYHELNCQFAHYIGKHTPQPSTLGGPGAPGASPEEPSSFAPIEDDGELPW